jgi:hypothetical protein
MPNRQAAGLQATEGGIEALIELDAAKIGTAVKLRLYQSSFGPTPASVYADFDANKADFAGYAAVDVVWSAVGVDAAGSPTLVSNDAFFQAADATSPNNIGGAFLTIQTAVGPPAVHKVLNYYPFGAAIPMVTALAFISLSVELQMPDLSGSADVNY